jgi:hypothetical protein
VSVSTASAGDTPPDDTPPDDTPPDDTPPDNTPPVAAAGPNQDLAIGESVDLDGNGSTDADGDALTYSWTLTTVPSGSDASLDDPTTPSPSFVADLAGTYVANLVVNDGTADSPPDTVNITAASDDTPGTNSSLSDNFDRPDSSEVGLGWVEVEGPGATVSIANEQLFFDDTSDAANHPMVKRGFSPVSAGTLQWDFDFDWARTGNEGTYTVLMQLGDGDLMSDSDLSDGTGVNLIWTKIDGTDETLGYSQAGVNTALAGVSGLASITVVADLDASTYSVVVNGTPVGSNIPFDANVDLNTVRFSTDGLNEANFSGRTFDNVSVLGPDQVT